MLSQLGARLRRLLSEDRYQAPRLEPEVGVVQLMRRVRERWDLQHNVLPVPRRFDIRGLVATDARVRAAVSPPPALAEADWNVSLPLNCFDANGHPTRLDDAFFAKREYRLDLLTSFDDAVFVSMAYRCILKRSPDRTGFNGYLSRLRGGEFDRIDVLRSLVRSSEAEPIGVHIPTLGKHDFWRRLQKLRVVGPFFEWGSAMIRLPRLVRRQLRIEAQATAWHRENHEETRRIVGAITGPMTASLASLDLARSQVEDGLTAVADVLERLDADGHRRLDDHEAQAIGFDDRLNRLDTAVELGRVRTEWLEKRFQLSSGGTTGAASTDDGSIARLCAEVEARLRAGAAATRAHAERRFAWMNEAGLGTRGPMLDLGCGRGDWLAALHERGLEARGVDASRDLVEACRSRGLAVECAEPLQWLSTAPAGSFGIVFALHLVEAMPLVTLVELLRSMRRALAADGLLVLETVDPDSSAGTRSSSGGRPVRPDRPVPLTPSVLEYLVGSQGFERIQVVRDIDDPSLGAAGPSGYAVVARTSPQASSKV